jgi:hypothetical protein
MFVGLAIGPAPEQEVLKAKKSAIDTLAGTIYPVKLSELIDTAIEGAVDASVTSQHNCVAAVPTQPRRYNRRLNCLLTRNFTVRVIKPRPARPGLEPAFAAHCRGTSVEFFGVQQSPMPGILAGKTPGVRTRSVVFSEPPNEIVSMADIASAN